MADMDADVCVRLKMLKSVFEALLDKEADAVQEQPADEVGLFNLDFKERRNHSHIARLDTSQMAREVVPLLVGEYQLSYMWWDPTAQRRKEWTGTVIAHQDVPFTVDLVTVIRKPIPLAQGLYRLTLHPSSSNLDKQTAMLEVFRLRPTRMGRDVMRAVLDLPLEQPVVLDDGTDIHTLPGGLPLDLSQSRAVRTALQSHLTLIRGQPGSGKTTTVMAIIVAILEKMKGSKVLLTSENNDTIMAMLRKVLDTLAPIEQEAVFGKKITVLVLSSRHYEHRVQDWAELHYLHKQVKVRVQANPELCALLERSRTTAGLTAKEEKRLRDESLRIGKEIVASADVVLATCGSTDQPALEDFACTHVIMEEAAKVTLPSALMPLLKRALYAVLVGDHRQLPPRVLSEPGARRGLGVSLFEYLYHKHKSITLTHNYRAGISWWAREVMADAGTMIDAPALLERKSSGWLQVLGLTQAVMWFNVMGQHQRGLSATWFFNRAEATLALRIAWDARRAGASYKDVVIVCVYEDQRALIQCWVNEEELCEDGMPIAQVRTADSFQGEEAKLVIVSFVLSKANLSPHQLGFLADAQRFFVIVTRAMERLVLLGNVAELSRDPLVGTHLRDAMAKHAVVDIVQGDWRAGLLSQAVLCPPPRGFKPWAEDGTAAGPAHWASPAVIKLYSDDLVSRVFAKPELQWFCDRNDQHAFTNQQMQNLWATGLVRLDTLVRFSSKSASMTEFVSLRRVLNASCTIPRRQFSTPRLVEALKQMAAGPEAARRDGAEAGGSRQSGRDVAFQSTGSEAEPSGRAAPQRWVSGDDEWARSSVHDVTPADEAALGGPGQQQQQQQSRGELEGHRATGPPPPYGQPMPSPPPLYGQDAPRPQYHQAQQLHYGQGAQWAQQPHDGWGV